MITSGNTERGRAFPSEFPGETVKESNFDAFEK